MKGRPASSAVYVGYYKGKKVISFADDPMNRLGWLRMLYRSNHERFGVRYGEIRQKVVSPVLLPDLRKES